MSSPALQQQQVLPDSRILPVKSLQSSPLYSLNNGSTSSLSSININASLSDSHFNRSPSFGLGSTQPPFFSTLAPSSSSIHPSSFSYHSNPSSSQATNGFLQHTFPSTPSLLHRWSHGYSILSIAVSKKKKLLFAGTQDSKILVFNLCNFQKICTVETDHNGSILNLVISSNENYLFSTSSDSLIKVWDIPKLTASSDNDPYSEDSQNKNKFNVENVSFIKQLTTIYSLVDVGDIFSIALSSELNILFFGSQNTSIQWINLSDKKNYIKPKMVKMHLNNLPSIRYDKFFDSKAPAVAAAAAAAAASLPNASSSSFSSTPNNDSDKQSSAFHANKATSPSTNDKIENYSNKLDKTKITLIEIPLNNIIPFAHNGFIYSMIIVSADTFHNTTFPNRPENYTNDHFKEYLVSAGGDGYVKIWGIESSVMPVQKPQLVLLAELENDAPVNCITISNKYFLHCGLASSENGADAVNIWDLSTFQLIKTLENTHHSSSANSCEINSLIYYPPLDTVYQATNCGINSIPLSTTASSSKASPYNATASTFLQKHLKTSTLASRRRNSSNLRHCTNFQNLNSCDKTASRQFNEMACSSAAWESEEKSILGVDILYDYNGSDDNVLITAGHSGVSIWNLPHLPHFPASTNHNQALASEPGAFSMDSLTSVGFENSTIDDEIDNIESMFEHDADDIVLGNSSLLKSLSTFITFQTVSLKPSLYIEQSRNCANFLSDLAKFLGANKASFLAVTNGNPVVHALFTASVSKESSYVPRVIFYGHYDVVDIESSGPASTGWNTDPFTLTAQDGYLRARGVSDNKGPIISAMYAIAELQHAGLLSCDVIFLIEGEGECGSFGFEKVISTHRNDILGGTHRNDRAIEANRIDNGNIDWVLFSNSYWLDDYTPCLNYGLRGLLSFEIEIFSAKPDRHSGVDGGVSREPTVDLINLLSELTDDGSGKVKVPGFYDPIQPICKDELQLYENIISEISERKYDDDGCNEIFEINDLFKKWRLPSLSIHSTYVSGPKNSTIIPQHACSTVSIRIVPNQEIGQVKKLVVDYLIEKFQQFNTENTLKIKVIKETEPWLGDINNQLYKKLNSAIEKEWKVKPWYIREGGSIPSIRFLEKFFNTDAAQIPCGQSSDNAHLNNERLRITNLFKLRNILVRCFKDIPKNHKSDKNATDNYNIKPQTGSDIHFSNPSNNSDDNKEFICDGIKKENDITDFINRLIVR